MPPEGGKKLLHTASVLRLEQQCLLFCGTCVLRVRAPDAQTQASTRAHVHSLRFEKMNINHFYGGMLQAPPPLKMCMETVPTLKFNIVSANLAKKTRADDTKPLLSFYGGLGSPAELQEEKAQRFLVGSGRTCQAPACSPCCGSLPRPSASRQRLTPTARRTAYGARRGHAVNAPARLAASCVCARTRVRSASTTRSPN